MARLQQYYTETVVNQLKEKLGLENVMEVPKITKITINMGVGEALADKKIMDHAVSDMTAISGQKPLITKSRIAIASFKLREDQAIGCKVTMRGDRMWEFFDRLLSVAIPRIRDFRGLSGKSWDGNGNYTFGLTEQLAFIEVRIDQVDVPRGMDITIVTSAKSDLAGKALLDAFGFPFRKGEVPASVTKAKKSKKK
jgi:large subunit ribosomal protein L5